MKILPISNPPSRNTTLPLIGVCVSYNYMDTLQFTLPVNYWHFEKLFIVTQEDDKETVAFCQSFENVQILFFDFKNNNKTFDKFGGIDLALEQAYRDYPEHWYLIIDSDIILPINIVSLLQKKELDSECIYGINRSIDYRSVSQWLRPKVSVERNPRDLSFHMRPRPLILGYFQLFKQHLFHQSKDNAGEGDLEFCETNFKRTHLFPRIIGLHLGASFRNWKGKEVFFQIDSPINITEFFFDC